MGLTSEKSLVEIQRLFDMCFTGNSMCDRQVYLLDIKFNMPKFSEWFHENIAHQTPLWADLIQSFGSLRGDLFYRGAIEKQDKEYQKPSEAMYDFVMFMAEMEKQCNVAINACIKNDDKAYEDMLRDFGLKVLSPYTKQATVFYRAIKDYENANSIYKWNKDFDDFIIFELGGDD